ncbi:protein phosphatase 1 regulatory subunit 3C-B-like isoform X3 [Anarhichas minor]|uniref:protein phosphatase 1 regulatory subunit 3C-B-like isoform X3 n=1 Tax=Anarhichas minor TaxID=65739 RepID=UPI003F739C7B
MLVFFFTYCTEKYRIVTPRVLHILNHHPGGPSPIMPVDMAVRIYLSSSPPLRSFLSNYDHCCSSSSSSSSLMKRCEALRSCLSFRNVATPTSTLAATEVVCPAWMRRKKKKSVVFADSRGLALTAIHVFNEAEDDILTELQFHLIEVEGAATGPHLGDNKDAADCGSGLVLDFTQPAADYLDLRNRLKAQQVLEPSNRVEFCIQYQTQDHTFWDNNHGNNYRLVDPKSSSTQSTENTARLEIWSDHGGDKDESMEFDPLGSPRTSAGNFPKWQSVGHVETSAPYW